MARKKAMTRPQFLLCIFVILCMGLIGISEVRHGFEVAELRMGQAELGEKISELGLSLDDLGRRIDNLAAALGQPVIENGLASFYNYPFHGRRTANGEIFDKDKLTAAHKTWSFGSSWLVRNLANGRAVIVTISDRGPYVDGRDLDLSEAAFMRIADLKDGLCRIMAIPITTNMPMIRLGRED
jgi:rare lipoprotein A